jgi:peptidoglycan/LPS O-acetylase OafA/YrhL
MHLLRRITTSGRFIPEIDGFRFLAIALVVMFHLNGAYRGQPGPVFTAIAERGAYGVQLFFTISGFILGLPFAAHYLAGKKPVNLRKYFLRRLTRLEPPYMLNILLVFAFGLFVSGKLSVANNIGHLFASLLYLHNAVYGHESFINTAAWSLEIEIQFYCLAPLLAKVFTLEHRRMVLFSAMLLIGGTQAIMQHPPARLTFSLAWELQYFLGGFLLADIYLTDWKEKPPRAWYWDAIAALGFVLVFSSTLTRGMSRLILPFCILLLYYAIFQSSTIGAFFRWWPITSLGGMCYTIYLYHASVISVLSRHIGRQHFVISCTILTAAIVFFSVIHFLLVEKPCMNPEWYRFRTWRPEQNVVTKQASA